MMTIGEASAINTLLRYALGMPGLNGRAQAKRDAGEAAAWLADRAHKTLSAGLDGATVRERWAREGTA